MGRESGHGLAGSSGSDFSQGCNQRVNQECRHLKGQLREDMLSDLLM